MYRRKKRAQILPPSKQFIAKHRTAHVLPQLLRMLSCCQMLSLLQLVIYFIHLGKRMSEVLPSRDIRLGFSSSSRPQPPTPSISVNEPTALLAFLSCVQLELHEAMPISALPCSQHCPSHAEVSTLCLCWRHHLPEQATFPAGQNTQLFSAGTLQFESLVLFNISQLIWHLLAI